MLTLNSTLYSCVLISVLIFFKLADCKQCIEGYCPSNSVAPLKFEDIVPNNYDKLVPPSEDGGPATVSVKISVLNINFVDEEKQSFGVDIFFHQVWKDPRIKIPPTHNTSRLVLDSNWRRHIWTPDTYFKKLVDGKVNDIIIPYSYIVVDENSELFFAARISLKLDCEMNLASYPHDVQQCEILIMSLQHTTKNVVLKWKEFQITENILLAQYYVSGNCSVNGTKKYDIGEFSFVSGRIHLARRLGYFLINKYIPCVLIICMSFVTFWIPAEAYPARVTLSVTSLLTIVTQQYQSAMPSVSYVVALNIWMLSCIGFVFCSLLEYAFVIAVMNNKGTQLWPFRKLEPILLFQMQSPVDATENNATSGLKEEFRPRRNIYSSTTWCRFTNLLKSSKNAKDAENGKSPTHSSAGDALPRTSHQTIDKISRLIFPLFFFIFCICYFIYFCCQ